MAKKRQISQSQITMEKQSVLCNWTAREKTINIVMKPAEQYSAVDYIVANEPYRDTSLSERGKKEWMLE